MRIWTVSLAIMMVGLLWSTPTGAQQPMVESSAVQATSFVASRQAPPAAAPHKSPQKGQGDSSAASPQPTSSPPGYSMASAEPHTLITSVPQCVVEAGAACHSSCRGDGYYRTACDQACDGWCTGRPSLSDEPWTLPQPCLFQQLGIRFGGWIDAGVSVVGNMPADRYNGVVTFNDRDGEPQLNQFWFFLDRPVDTSAGGWDLGGRIDFVFGTDARFTQAADGLEASWNQTARSYQAALPQFFVDIAYNDWLFRGGHFFTILGYEVVPAVANFFYSHSYTMQYGEPFTHTGFLLARTLGPNWKITGGLHRGNDQFDDTDGLDAVNFLGGLTWIADEQWASATFALSTTEQGPGVKQQIYSVVSTVRVTQSLKYVFQSDFGQTFDGNTRLKADWYGINQYLFYTINPCWTAGLRVEWFRDENGTRVRGLGDGNLNQGPWNQFVGADGRVNGFFAGDFWEISAGLNWKPLANVTVRPELRWDWFDSRGVESNGPYDAGQGKSQFLFGCDMVVTF